MQIWIVKEFSIFSVDRAVWDAFCRRSRSESKSKRAQKMNTRLISSFSDQCEIDSFFFFFNYWNKLHRDWVALNSFRMRDELLSKMFACRSIAVWFIRASARSRWVYALEISQNRYSIWSLWICILYEWCSTCWWFTCDIWFSFVIDLNVNWWKRHAFQLSESKSRWLEKNRKCFVNNDFVWLQVCWSFSIFYSWACVKRRRCRWEPNEQQKCTTLESF
jgi:hypothetical protein